MKQVIIYNTITGMILQIAAKSHDTFVSASGDGALVGNTIAGVALATIDINNSALIEIKCDNGRSIRASLHGTVKTGQSIKLNAQVRKEDEGQVTFKVYGIKSPTKYSQDQVDSLITSQKDIYGHENIDAINVDTNIEINMKKWKVNVATKRLEESNVISYEDDQ